MDTNDATPEGVASSEGLGRAWRCTVDCWYADKPRSKMRHRVRRTIVLLASDSNSAMTQAKKHASATAPMGPKWLAFEVLSAATVRLPMTVASWHGRPIRAA